MHRAPHAPIESDLMLEAALSCEPTVRGLNGSAGKHPTFAKIQYAYKFICTVGKKCALRSEWLTGIRR